MLPTVQPHQANLDLVRVGDESVTVAEVNDFVRQLSRAVYIQYQRKARVMRQRQAAEAALAEASNPLFLS
jgi:pantothenate kinase